MSERKNVFKNGLKIKKNAKKLKEIKSLNIHKNVNFLNNRKFRAEKMERLKRGPSKHEFNDQNYLKARDIILDQTEDAIEAGMKALVNAESSNEVSQSVESDSSFSSSSDDSDFDFYDSAKLVLRKRKLKKDHGDSVISKKLKVEYTSEVIFEYFTDKIIEEVAQLIIIEFQKKISEEKQQKKNIGFFLITKK